MPVNFSEVREVIPCDRATVNKKGRRWLTDTLSRVTPWRGPQIPTVPTYDASTVPCGRRSRPSISGRAGQSPPLSPHCGSSAWSQPPRAWATVASLG